MGFLGEVIEIDCSLIRPFAGQPRKTFNALKMEELTASIKAVQQRKPITVRELPHLTTASGPVRYEIVDGERRWRVCSQLGFPIKAWVKSIVDEREQFLDSVISNFSSAEHDPLETYEAVVRIKREHEYTIAETANAFGKSGGWVIQYLSLGKLKSEIRQLLSEEIPENKRLSFTSALFVARLPEEKQQGVVDIILAKGLVLQQVKNLVAKQSGSIVSSKNYRPKKEGDKLNNFIIRSRRDIEILMMQTPQYYRDLLASFDRMGKDRLFIEIQSLIDDLKALQDTLVRRTQSAKV